MAHLTQDRIEVPLLLPHQPRLVGAAVGVVAAVSVVAVVGVIAAISVLVAAGAVAAVGGLAEPRELGGGWGAHARSAAVAGAALRCAMRLAAGNELDPLDAAAAGVDAAAAVAANFFAALLPAAVQ